MATFHAVQGGECAASIAAAYGFGDVDAVWQHADNEALRRSRPSPNVLAPGDRIAVPERELKEIDAEASRAHRFKVTRPKVELAIKILDDHDAPLAGKKYRIESGDARLEGTTDGEGFVRAPIPIDWTAAELLIWADAAEEGAPPPPPSARFVLEIGNLTPRTKVEGAQARLANLGYWCGAADGQIGPRTRHALRAFQARHDLPITGALDDATATKLEDIHGV